MFHIIFYLTLTMLVVDCTFIRDTRKGLHDNKSIDIKDMSFHNFRFRVTNPRQQTVLDHLNVREVRSRQNTPKSKQRIRMDWSSHGPFKTLSREPFRETSGPKMRIQRKPSDPAAETNWVPPQKALKRGNLLRLHKKKNILATQHSNPRDSTNSTGIPHNHNSVYTGITDYRNIVEKYKTFREQSLNSKLETFDYGINEYLEIKNMKNLEGFESKSTEGRNEGA